MHPRLPIGFPLLPAVALTGAILGSAAFGAIHHLSYENKAARLSRELAQAQDDLARESRQLQFVNSQIARATSPEVIRQRIAELRLPLAPPREDQILRKGSAGSLRGRNIVGGLP